jgi:hypothetical protein
VADPADALEQALRATEAALVAGDAVAAAEASGRAAQACAGLEAAGVALPPARAAGLSDLQRRCEAAAGRHQAKLGAELDVAARSSRAVAAYRR